MKTIGQRRKRWLDFYNINDKSKFLFQIQYNNFDVPSPKLLWPENKNKRIEWSWESYNLQMEQIQWLADDLVPFVSLTSGTEIFAEAMGAKVYRPEDNMPFAIPFINSVAEASKLKTPPLYSTPLTLLFDVADELRCRGGSKVIMKLPDIQSPMDILAQIWDKTDLFLVMIEEPEAVIEAAYKIRLLLTAFLDEWFKRYGDEFIAHYPNYYMPNGISISVDEVGNVGEAMFGRFFTQELNEMSGRYGGLGVHCCANSRHQWDNFKSLKGLRLINLVQPADIIEQSYEFFSPEVAHMHSELYNGTDRLLPLSKPDAYPEGTRAIVLVQAASRDEAKKIAENLQQMFGEC